MAALDYPDYFNDAFVVTPSDSDNLEDDAANTAGYKYAALRVYAADGNTIRFVTTEGTVTNLTLGAGVEYIPGQIKQVRSTGTTGTIEITALVKK